MDLVREDTEPIALVAKPQSRFTTFGGGVFCSLQFRDFRLLWTGLIFSFVGFSIQQISLNWLVYSMTRDPFYLSLMNAANNLPMLALSLFGGAMADRIDKRRLLMVCRGILLTLIALLAVLVITKQVAIWQMMLIAGTMGIVWSFDLPTRQALVVSLVPKENLMNALALNSAVMSSTQIAGPALAGVLVGLIDVGGCFLVASVLYFGLIIAIYAMHPPKAAPKSKSSSVLQDMVEGLKYIRHDETLTILLIAFAMVGMFGMTYSILMPAFAGSVLKTEASGYAMLMSASAIGALIGAMTMARLSNFERKGTLLLITSLSASTGLAVFAFTSWLPISMAVLVIVGATMSSTNTTITTLTLTRSDAQYHGRLMSVNQVCWGMSPVGGMLLGSLASRFGTPWGIGTGAVTMGLFMGWMFASRRHFLRL